MTSPIVDFSDIDLTGSVKFEDQQISSVYYRGERLWPFGVDLLYTGGIGGASYLPDLDRAFSSFYADAPGSFGDSIAALEATNDREPLNYSDIFLAGNEGDAFVVAPAYCFTDLAGTIQAGEGDVVLAMRGVVKGTLITQSDPASQPVLEKDARGVWSLRCNGNKFLRSSELFTVAANFTVTVAMSVLSLTGIPGGSHVLGPALAKTGAYFRVRASGTGGASSVGTSLCIAGGAIFIADIPSAFQVGVPFVATGMHEGSTITARQGDLLFNSAAANAGTGTAQANLQLGVSGGYDARFYGGVYINRALSQTERMRIEKRMKLDFGIRPDGAIASGQLSASLRPLLGRAPKAGRRNLFVFSENLLAAQWNRNQVSVAQSEGPMPSGVAAAFKVTEAATTDNHSVTQQASFVAGTKYTIWTRAKFDGRYLQIIPPTASLARGYANFDLQNGVKGDFGGSGLTSEMIPEGDGWHLCSITFTASGSTSGTPSFILVTSPTSARLQQYLGNGVSGLHLGGPQIEVGDRSPYQRVGAAVDVTEEGVPSYPFVRFDLSDDRLETVLPQAVTGDVVIAGRNGSVIAPHSYAADSTFQLGPTSYTGGTPGILRAIGDVVGWSILDKTLTAAERERLMRFYKRRGAKGLLVPGGPELIVNGGFDTDTSWIKTGSASISGGVGLVSNGSAGSLASNISFSNGKSYLLFFSTVYNTGRMEIDIALGSSLVTYITLPPSSGSYSLVFSATGAADRIRFIGRDSPTPIVTIDDVSLVELRPEEEW